MAPTTLGRRSRSNGLAAALAFAAAYQLVQGPLAFLPAAGRRQCPRARSALVARHTEPGRPPLTSLAARGGGERPDMTLTVGDKVKAQSPDDEMWYPGRIQETTGGNFVVAWDDPDGGPETNTLSESSIKKLIFFKDYQEGDDCRAISPDDERWYPGTVAGVLGEGKFRVKWDDPDGGDETADLHFESIKKVKVKRDYKKGDMVLGRFPEDGMMYDAVVLAENKDGTFQVKWDDPDGGPEDSAVSPKDMKIPPIPFDKLEVGQKYTGTVVSIRDFGAFIDIGAESEGLLHISRISKERVEDVYDYLEDEQEVECWISGLRDDGKFGLTLIEGQKDSLRTRNTDVTAFADISPEEWLEAEVVDIAPFGAFVQVTLESGEQAQGLVHISQVAEGFVENIHDHIQNGQQVKVRVLNVDVDNSKLSFTMKEGFAGAPQFARTPVDLGPFEGVDPSTWLTGTVARIAAFGVFVKVQAPDSDAAADGLVHITQIRDGFVESVEDEVEVGQEVQVRVLGVDIENSKMSLSMIAEGEGGRPSREPVDLQPFEGIDPSTWLTGKVVSATSFGAFVTVQAPDSEATAEGLVHITQIKDGFIESVEDEVEVGQEVQVRVVGVDVENGKMSLSMKAEDGA